jgi:hypothetical protein
MNRKALLLVLLLLVALAAVAQESKPAPGLTLESVKVDPASPGPDTLCKLSVTVKNAGAKTASALGFRVKVDGKELAVYKNELFFRPVAAGGTTEIKLHNFWSSETGRPFPTGGRMTVEVTLAEARWMDVKTENGAEVWTPVGAVEGLPVSKSVTLTLGKPAK